jgi:hypothetical protein
MHFGDRVAILNDSFTKPEGVCEHSDSRLLSSFSLVVSRDKKHCLSNIVNSFLRDFWALEWRSHEGNKASTEKQATTLFNKTHCFLHYYTRCKGTIPSAPSYKDAYSCVDLFSHFPAYKWLNSQHHYHLYYNEAVMTLPFKTRIFL